MRSRIASPAMLLGVLSCRPAPVTPPTSPDAVPTQSRRDESPPPVAEAPSLFELVFSIVLMPPASIVVEYDYDTQICEREGYPDTLSDKAAAELGDAKPGSPVTIVHRDGQTTASIVSAGCQEEEEYLHESATLLILDQPAGPEAPGSEIQQMLGPPYLAFVGIRPVPEARLEPPPVMTWESAVGVRVRERIATLATEIVAKRTKRCRTQIDEGDIQAPGAEATQAAMQRVQASLLAASPPVVWLQFNDPAITFACHDEYSEMEGILLDVESGTELISVKSNNGVDLQWVTDLDGDGAMEGLVDIQWLEDAGHKIILLARDESGWEKTTLYESDEP